MLYLISRITVSDSGSMDENGLRFTTASQDVNRWHLFIRKDLLRDNRKYYIGLYNCYKYRHY